MVASTQHHTNRTIAAVVSPNLLCSLFDCCILCFVYCLHLLLPCIDPCMHPLPVTEFVMQTGEASFGAKEQT
jgi:hypothetical protein